MEKNEKILICGDRTGLEGWHQVPLRQAEYHLRIVLQKRGYLRPRFERQNGRLLVWKNTLFKTRHFTVDDPSHILNPTKKRHMIGTPLSPQKLSEAEHWADLQLRRKGYACPQVESTARIWNRTIHLQVHPGRRQKILRQTVSGFEGLDPQVLTRYQAFHVGDFYNVIEPELTTQRLVGEGILQSAYYSLDCLKDGVTLHLHASVGKPKAFRFGFGASTEEWPFIDLTYKNARLDTKASSFTATAHASQILQSLDARAELYIFPRFKRIYIGPRTRWARQSERTYEVNQAKAGVDIGRSWDWRHSRIKLKGGPTLNYTDTVRGIGPDKTSYLSWNANVTALSHAYEYFFRNQSEGWIWTFNYSGQRKGLGSPVSADRYDVSFKSLFNLGGYTPPLFVLAWRVSSSWVNANVLNPQDNNRDILPIDDRIFLGGDQSLRGFSRQSINNNGLGYLSSIYSGFELRLVDELPYRLQPLVLFDIAKVGDRKGSLERAVLTSLGAGLRWASPFGTFRGTLAKGEISEASSLATTYPHEWVAFLSFGQEF